MGKFLAVAKNNAAKLANAIADLDKLAFRKRLRVNVVHSIAPGVVAEVVCRGLLASHYSVSVEGVHEILRVHDPVLKIFHGISATALHEVRHRQQFEYGDRDLLRPEALRKRHPRIADMLDAIQFAGKDHSEVLAEYDAVARQMMYTKSIVIGRISPSLNEALRFVRASSTDILRSAF